MSTKKFKPTKYHRLWKLDLQRSTASLSEGWGDAFNTGFTAQPHQNSHLLYTTWQVWTMEFKPTNYHIYLVRAWIGFDDWSLPSFCKDPRLYWYGMITGGSVIECWAWTFARDSSSITHAKGSVLKMYGHWKQVICSSGQIQLRFSGSCMAWVSSRNA